MKRTDASGHALNLYSVGNPSLGVLPTVVGAEEMNNIQEELALLVEEAGLTVDQTGATLNQVQAAIKILIEAGGTVNGKMTLANNQTVTDVTVISAFDKTAVKSAKILVDLFRRDDVKSANQIYELYAVYDPEGDAWSLSYTAKGDDAEVTFSITSAGQIQYASTNFAGGNYSGDLRASHVQRLAL